MAVADNIDGRKQAVKSAGSRGFFGWLGRRQRRCRKDVQASELRTSAHDSVAYDLVDCALVAVDGLHHMFVDRVEDLARFLRIPVGQQPHRVFEVGEELVRRPGAPPNRR